MIRPLGVPVEERTTRSDPFAGTASKGALTGRILVLPALLAFLISWWRRRRARRAALRTARRLAAYNHDHPAPLPLTHPQRRRAYKRAAIVLARVQRRGGSDAA